MKAGVMIRRAAMLLAPALAACGVDQGDYVGARLDLPKEREARVTVTPAVDLSHLVDERLARGLTIESVAINLADARLVGADPRLPPGGYPLLDGPTVVYAEGPGKVGIELPFPPEFLGQEDLAVYLRTEPSEEMGGAAVRVIGSLSTGGAALTGMIDPEGDPAHEQGMIDPEGDPAHEQGMIDPEGDPAREQGMIDPEGDPAHEEGMIDPEGDPARDGQTSRQGQALSTDGAARLILVDKRGTELVVSFQAKSRFNVVFGIRADAWLNDLAKHGSDGRPDPGPDLDQRDADDARTVIIDADAHALGAEVEEQFHGTAAEGTQVERDPDAYYGGEDIPVEDSIVRDPFGGF